MVRRLGNLQVSSPCPLMFECLSQPKLLDCMPMTCIMTSTNVFNQVRNNIKFRLILIIDIQNLTYQIMSWFILGLSSFLQEQLGNRSAGRPGPFKVLKLIGPNVYVIDINTTLNIIIIIIFFFLISNKSSAIKKENTQVHQRCS